jgi:squalene-associated FAD-dependent desaturase
VAIVGGGWAGLAAAVEACQAGHAVTLFETTADLGGRARTVRSEGLALDNGQHILIGAYTHTLALMKTVGADADKLLHRQPLELRYPDGRGLRLPKGPAGLAFGLAVMRCKGWSASDRWALLREAARWTRMGFSCDPQLTVAELCKALPAPVRKLLIDPMCIAALNTPAEEASATVFLRVLLDALFSGRGSADLLLPRAPLGSLLPEPASAWLLQAGAELKLGKRVNALHPHAAGWRINEQDFAAVILACPPAEAARLAKPFAANWAQRAQALRYEPIITVWLHSPKGKLPTPMAALFEGPGRPAQFAFDHGALGGTPGHFAFVISGAAASVAKGLKITANEVQQQAISSFPEGTWYTRPQILKVLAEKRATFRCTPGLDRPPMRVAESHSAQAATAPLLAAGDYVAGPYPATLEGAVRSGQAAAQALGPVRA